MALEVQAHVAVDVSCPVQHMDEDPWDLEAAARAPPIRGKVSDTSGILSREVVAGALEGPVTNSTAVATAGIPAAKDVLSGT